MYDFNQILGNDAVVQSLRTALNHRFPQAVLFTGPSGSGKLTLARVIAAGLLCTSEHERPCGTCASCRKLAGDVHPDLDLIDEGDSDLPVALARSLRQKVYVLPNDGDRRVVIIRHAHKLNTAAQNALLKVLEEPPVYAFFILTSEQPGAVLETIRSRCTHYQLAPRSSATVDTDALMPFVSPFAHALAEADEFHMLQAAMALEKLQKPVFSDVLGLIQAVLHDSIFCANGLSGRVVPALSDVTERLASRIGSKRLIQLYDHISVLSRRTEGNAAATIQCAVLCASAYKICFL